MQNKNGLFPYRMKKIRGKLLRDYFISDETHPTETAEG
jgi:hypothetical protein